MEFSENFRRSLHFVFGNEGGLSNHPADKGGLTMMGITSGTLAAANKQGIVSCSDIRKLTREEAAEIYEVNYWERSHANDVPWPLCCLHFDAAVNSGIGGAGRLLQRTLNSLFKTGLLVDGSVGSQTLRELKHFIALGKVNAISTEYCNQREELYKRIVKNNPAQRIFLNGWLNRLARNRQLIEVV